MSLGVTGLALAFALLSTPLYRAETRLLIEARESVFTRTEANADNNNPVLDEEGVTSQVEVIGSTDILKRVAEKLDLASYPEFDDAADMSLVGRLLVATGLRGNPGEMPAEERVLRALRDKLTVYRVERSRVIVVEFSSESPKLAAEVPNAIAETYLAVQQAAKSQSNADATQWLEPEIADLGRRVKEAELKVAAFRSHSDLLVGQNNSVLATQQLSELSTELSRVRANRSAAEATAEGVRAALKSGASLDSMPEVMSSGLIQRLRETQVQLKAQIADLSTSLLSGHPRIRALNSQLADLDAQIRNEAQKVLAGLETEAKRARMREDQLVSDLNRLKAESARAGEQEVELRALEREAAAQRELLESYMTRYREASSRNERNYSPVDARIFERATPPSEPYFPKVVPIAIAAFVASLLVMSIVTLLSELFSGRAMRPAAGTRAEPVADVDMRPPARAVEARVPIPADLATAPPPPPLPPAPAMAAPPAASARPAFRKASKLGEVSIETAAERLIAGGASRAIFVSPEGDNAAAAAILVTREVADSGLRVVLVDLTSNGAASRPMLESGNYRGITNLLASEAQFSDVIHADHFSDAHVIPLGTADPERAMRAADRLPIIMRSLTTAYDLVVVECGAADAESIRRLTGEGTEVLVSVLEPRDLAIEETAAALAAEGYDRLILVSPAGYQPPVAPVPDRSAA